MSKSTKTESVSLFQFKNQVKLIRLNMQQIKLGLNILLLLIGISAQAQINGNGEIKTIKLPLEGLKFIDIQFNANITIDFKQEESIQISADENIMNNIGRSFENGKLTLDQIKWIEPSQQPIITIGASELKKIFQGTHSSTWVKNLEAENFTVAGNVGKLILEGSVNQLIIDVEQTNVDAKKVIINKADVTINGRGKVTLDKVHSLNANIDENGRLIRLSEPKDYIGMTKDQLDGVDKKNRSNSDLRYISFKIKNNSWNRNHFVVVGPKKDGSTFSYGFPMMPFTSKSETWTIGTKIYKEKKMGTRELLVTITEEDENQTVELFD